MKLISICNKRLQEAKKKVEVLVKEEGKKFQLSSFDEENIDE